MAKPWKRGGGTTRGRASSAPVLPKMPLPPLPSEVFDPPGRVSSTGQDLDALVVEAVRAFVDASAGRNARQLLAKYRGEWYGAMRVAVGLMRQGGLRPSAFVRFVYGRVRILRGRAPYPQEVFARKAVEAWTSEYQRRAVNFLRTAHYEAAPDRRRDYESRFLLGMKGPQPRRRTA